MKSLIIIAAMLLSIAAYSQINVVIDQDILTRNIDNFVPVYPTFNSYFCPQTQCWHEYNMPPPPIEISNNINIIYIDMDNLDMGLNPEDQFDELDGIIYNTSVPDEFEAPPLPLPEDLIPPEEYGVTQEKELLH